MRNQALLLVDTYPLADFSKSAQSDLDFLNSVFEEVIVLAYESEQADESISAPSSSIRVFVADPPSDNTLKVACGSCNDVAVDELRPYLRDYDNEALRKSPSRWIYFRSFSARVVAVRDAIKKLLEQGVIGTGVVLCSYGFNEATVAALMARSLSDLANSPVIVKAQDNDYHHEASPVGYIPLLTWQSEQVTQVLPGFESDAIWQDARTS